MLALPTGFLAERALRGVAAERELRHRAVAERAFDEMERALSGLLRDEEDRPALQYIAFAALPPPAFVLGHFELETDGSAHTDVAEPEQAGRVLAAARAIAVDSGARDAKEGRAALEAKREAVAQAPGTTDWIGGLGRIDARRDAPAPAAAPPARAYDALQKLNRGVQERRMRAQKQEMQQSASAHEELAAPGEFAESATSLRDFAGSASAAAPAVEAAPAPIPGRLAIDPLVGRLLPDGQLLLVRVVWSGPRVIRQGVVLDVAGLGAWLRAGALAGALPDATLSVLPAEVGASTNAAAFRYRHRFAEPFDALAGELALAPLPDAPGAASVPWLVALGVGALALGLFAAWRTIATQLHFAERRSNFVAAVSHELKTPLTAIRMYAEMLRDGMVPSEEKRKSYLGSITAEAERLSRLIGNVLEFSRLERGAHGSGVPSADPLPLLHEAAALLRPHIEGAGFRLALELEPGLPAVRFGRDALLQVLFNLVDNAVKYGRGAGEAVIELSARAARAGVELRVRDHGPGVAPAQLSRILEPFYRGGDELTRRAAGSGIGLALVRGLVDEMGGSLAVRNAAGGGFEAVVTLRGEDGEKGRAR